MAEHSFSAHLAWTLALRLLAIAGNVLAGVIVARWLGAEGVGALAVLNITIATAVLLGSAGLPSSNIFFVARHRHLLSRVAVNSFVFALIVGVLLALVIVIAAPATEALFHDLPPPLIVVASVAIPFQLALLLGINIFLAVGNISTFNSFEVIRQSSMLLSSLVALVLLGAGLFMLVTLNSIASALLSVYLIWSIRRYGQKQQNDEPWRPDAKLFRQMLRYGLKFHIATVVPLLIFRGDLIIVKYFHGASEAGVYDVATQASLLLMLLPGVVGTLLFPRVTAEEDREGLLTSRATRHTAFVMLVLCLLAAALAIVFPLIYGNQFAGATLQFWVLLPGVFLVSVESVMVQHFSAMGLPVLVPLFWLATLVLNLILNFALIPAWGGLGAAISSTLSYTMIFVLVAAYFGVVTGQGPGSMLLLNMSELRALVSFTRRGGYRWRSLPE